jgi:putative flippase GtrA
MSARFGRFGAVGATGLVVNTLALVVLVDVLALWLVAAAVLATQVSTLWNFLLTDRWVFPPGARKMSTLRRAGAFLAMNNAALLLRIPLLYLLVTALGVHHAIANVASLLALTLIRFGAADTYIWARAEAPVEFQYDIHGIITIASEGRLPELQRFRVDGVIPDPTIRIRLGHVASKGVGAIALDDRRTLVYYADRLGDLGFGVEIELGERIHIVASPLLRHSPHVLYTNVVEPVLRWAFVERDHALVHAACMASGAHAFLITARTDTGKTTTALKTLDNLPFSFLSDDLTLLTRDGRALTYPKPLTISRHTLSSVKTPLLSRRERAALIVQSRLHSKSGRLFGLILARTRIPAATMNAWVQRLVPPPKFQVDRLVPHVTVIPEAQIAGMAIIQRDGVEESTLVKPQEAMDILLSNCEDAYGFPPYPAIQRWLHSRNGLDLRAVERSIISDAMRGRPSYVLKSEQRNWYRMLPRVVEQTVADLPTDLDEPLACMPAPFALPA